MNALETSAAGALAGGTTLRNAPAGPTVERPPAPPAPPAPVEFRYTQTESFVALLHELRASLLVSTYQANKLLAVRAQGQGLSTLVRTFDKPMGLAADGKRLAVGTRKEVWFLRNAPDIAPRIEPAGQHDACFHCNPFAFNLRLRRRPRRPPADHTRFSGNRRGRNRVWSTTRPRGLSKRTEPPSHSRAAA